MYPRLALLISLSLPSIGLMADTEATELENIVFQNWSGLSRQTVLIDGSVLTEYVARTFSGNSDGAGLTVSFIPRFDCAPMVSIELPPGLVDLNSSLGFSVDQQDADFPFLVDTEESKRIRISLNADGAGQKHLRQSFDHGSHASLHWSKPEPDDGKTTVAEPGVEGAGRESVYFSLLGSRMTVKAVEGLCIAHKPIPYKN